MYIYIYVYFLYFIQLLMVGGVKLYPTAPFVPEGFSLPREILFSLFYLKVLVVY